MRPAAFVAAHRQAWGGAKRDVTLEELQQLQGEAAR